MHVTPFRASTKYADFKGTSSMDESDKTGPREFLKSKDLLPEGEFLLGIDVDTMELHGKYKDPLSVTFYFAQPGDHDNVKAMIEASKGPIMVRRVQVDIELTEFMAMFKRFSVAFSSHGMLEGHEITYLDY
ncbi:hypothetical protein [Caenimonas sp. SL110]|uniref:hypothetical protein n=1 Tax=Caenimonas sp. SL110 TaxID=1450524 RepID=UPI000652CD7C|nr:hypothetical protein [Caenimonas sp. SL110]